MNFEKSLKDQNEPMIGTFLVSRSQAALEVMAEVGYDFVVIDTEHFMVNPESIERLVTAAEAADIVPFVRVQENIHLIQRALDCGAKGVVAPMIDSPEEAKKVVDTAKYAPIGDRGVCNPRSVIYGANGPGHMVQSYKEQNKQTTIIVQAETVEATRQLDDILGVEGIDVLFVGPWDLSNSMGMTGQPGSDKVSKQVKEMLEQTTERGIPAGILAWDGDDAKKRIEQGFQFIVLSGDMIMLSESTRTELEKAREVL